MTTAQEHHIMPRRYRFGILKRVAGLGSAGRQYLRGAVLAGSLAVLGLAVPGCEAEPREGYYACVPGIPGECPKDWYCRLTSHHHGTQSRTKLGRTSPRRR